MVAELAVEGKDAGMFVVGRVVDIEVGNVVEGGTNQKGVVD